MFPPAPVTLYSHLTEHKVIQRYWRIRGYDDTREIFELWVELEQISYERIKQVLKTLVAKATLNYSEIVGAYAKRRTKFANNNLAVSWESESGAFRCGTDLRFTASVVDANGKTVSYPKLP
jgi:hypothetical protein